jgi:hypothetical protein
MQESLLARRRQAAKGPRPTPDHIAHATHIDEGLLLAYLGD